MLRIIRKILRLLPGKKIRGILKIMRRLIASVFLSALLVGCIVLLLLMFHTATGH